MKYLLYLFLAILGSLINIVIFSWIISMLLGAMNEPDTLTVAVAVIGIFIGLSGLTLSLFYIWYLFFRLTFKPKV